MIEDFGEAWRCIIEPDGAITKPFVFIPDTEKGMVWMIDPDGLALTLPCQSPNGKACLLTVLFPMDQPKATWHFRCHRWPFRIGDAMHVTRRKDVVTGNSGEVYSRFLVTVQKGGE